MTHAGRAASSPEIFRPFLTVCLTVFPFEFRPRTSTIGFYGKKSFISELMILECSFPLTQLVLGSTSNFKIIPELLPSFQLYQNCRENLREKKSCVVATCADFVANSLFRLYVPFINQKFLWHILAFKT